MSIGIDCEDISRFNKIVNNENLLKKIFTKREIDYCMSKANPPQHFAVRFAGKEAVIKAINTSDKKVSISQIEILNNDAGSPIVNLLDKDPSLYDIKLSLSHSKETAIAFSVVIQGSV